MLPGMKLLQGESQPSHAKASNDTVDSDHGPQAPSSFLTYYILVDVSQIRDLALWAMPARSASVCNRCMYVFMGYGAQSKHFFLPSRPLRCDVGYKRRYFQKTILKSPKSPFVILEVPYMLIHSKRKNPLF